MAKDDPKAAPPESHEWETVGGSLGTEWDFERDGALTGHFLGTQTVETPSTRTGMATAVQFAPEGASEDVVFVWQSTELAMFSDETAGIKVGDLFRIQFLGREQFTDKQSGEPRQVKRYRVQRAKS